MPGVAAFADFGLVAGTPQNFERPRQPAAPATPACSRVEENRDLHDDRR
jgi:hypothetical protein